MNACIIVFLDDLIALHMHIYILAYSFSFEKKKKCITVPSNHIFDSPEPFSYYNCSVKCSLPLTLCVAVLLGKWIVHLFRGSNAYLEAL